MSAFLAVLVILCVLVNVVAFRNGYQMRQYQGSRSALSSYAEQLKKARQARSGGAPAAPAAPSTPVAHEPALIQPASSGSDAPFSDEMYEHLTFVISQLSGRIKSDAALNPNDLEHLKASIDAIVRDINGDALTPAPAPAASMPAVTAEGLSPPVTTVDPNYESATPKLKAGVWIPEPGQEKGRPITEADPKSAFAPLHGVRNTWQIKGMESMTTEEYYDNLLTYS